MEPDRNYEMIIRDKQRKQKGIEKKILLRTSFSKKQCTYTNYELKKTWDFETRVNWWNIRTRNWIKNGAIPAKQRV